MLRQVGCRVRGHRRLRRTLAAPLDVSLDELLEGHQLPRAQAGRGGVGQGGVEWGGARGSPSLSLTRWSEPSLALALTRWSEPSLALALTRWSEPARQSQWRGSYCRALQARCGGRPRASGSSSPPRACADAHGLGGRVCGVGLLQRLAIVALRERGTAERGFGMGGGREVVGRWAHRELMAGQVCIAPWSTAGRAVTMNSL